MSTVATIIDLYGDTYWPIFDVLKAELEELEARQAKLAEYASSRRANPRPRRVQHDAHAIRKSSDTNTNVTKLHGQSKRF